MTLSVYNRLSWTYNYVYRSSQHAVLSSNTLGELYDVIPCPSNELPDEFTVNEAFAGYESGPSKRPSGYVVVIGNTAHGDGLTENDYARYAYRLLSADPGRPSTHTILASSELTSRNRSPSVRRCTTRPSPHSHFVLIIHIGYCITAIANISLLSIKFGMSSPLLMLAASLNFLRLACCTHTILPLGTRLQQESRLRSSETAAHVRKFRLYIQSLETCALARVRVSSVHPVGGRWGYRRVERPKIS